MDDEYELFKYSLLLSGNRSLVDVVGEDTLDSLICTRFADVSNLTPDQKKLNEKLLTILKDLPYFRDDTEDNCITKLERFLQENENNNDLKAALDLRRGESKLTVLHALSSVNDSKNYIDLLLKAGAKPDIEDYRGKPHWMLHLIITTTVLNGYF